MQVQDAIAGDLEDPAQLEAIAKARSYNKEIIVIASNAAGAKITFNLLLSLQAQGISHVVWLTDDPTYCKALFYSPLRVACAHTTYLRVRLLTQPVDFTSPQGAPVGCSEPSFMRRSRNVCGIRLFTEFLRFVAPFKSENAQCCVTVM